MNSVLSKSFLKYKSGVFYAVVTCLFVCIMLGQYNKAKLVIFVPDENSFTTTHVTRVTWLAGISTYTKSVISVTKMLLQYLDVVHYFWTKAALQDWNITPLPEGMKNSSSSEFGNRQDYITSS